jgi:SAM-dependent methyltransferase
LEQYRRLAQSYDRRTRWGNGLRWVTVSRLRPTRGSVVLDVGCGTGINFPFIQRRIGDEGRIVGIELSPDMLLEARTRVEQHDWNNVTLIESAVDEADIPVQADAALFSLTHDVLQSVAAVENVMAHLKRGGRVSSLGAKWAPWWATPVNLAVWFIARRYVTTGGFSRPWQLLERYVPDLQVESFALGGAYIAWGTKG